MFQLWDARRKALNSNMTKPKDWHWKRVSQRGEWHLRDGRARVRAIVYPNGTWHTFDEHGVGGENAEEGSAGDAMVHAEHAVMAQGWTSWAIAYIE